ncbi:MAG: RNA methyltransferase [Candidatus Eisenbacteria bacterium]
MSRDDDRPRPTISSRRHPLVARIRRLSRRPGWGEQDGAFLLDGIHLLEEALESRYQPEAILVDERLQRTDGGNRLRACMESRGWPLHEVPEDLLSDLATTKTAQGVLGLFRRIETLPLPTLGGETKHGLAALVFAGLQDPQNLGALARAAHVFGCPRLIALEGTVDFFHPRALRASSGSLLHLDLFADVGLGDLARWIESEGVAAAALMPRGGTRIDGLALSPRPYALVLGSEGGGIADEAVALCGERWSIPMTAHVDSLGVAAAGAIALYAVSAMPDGSAGARDSRR